MEQQRVNTGMPSETPLRWERSVKSLEMPFPGSSFIINGFQLSQGSVISK